MALSPEVLIYRWFNEVWNEGREETIDELCASGAVGHGLGEAGTDTHGPDAFKVFFRNLRTAIPDLHVRIEDAIVQSEKAAVRLRLDGTHLGPGLGIPPSGRSVSIAGIVIVRVIKGQIAEAWNNWDQLGLLKQIGAIPASSTADRFLSANV